MIYFQDCLWLLHSSRSGVNISAPWLLLLSRLEVNKDNDKDKEKGKDKDKDTLASTTLQARGEQCAHRKYYREVKIKEVGMVAVDDFDDILQEELFGRPVTDLDSLWCSD